MSEAAVYSALGLSVVSLGIGAGGLGRSVQNKSDIDNLNTQISGLRDSSVSLIAAVKDVNEILPPIASQLAKTGVDLTVIQTEVKVIETQTQALDSRVNSVESRVTALEDQVMIVPVLKNNDTATFQASLDRFQVIVGNTLPTSVVLPDVESPGAIISIMNGLTSITDPITNFENTYRPNLNVSISSGEFVTFVNVTGTAGFSGWALSK
jgi:hypothetical protein